MENGVFPPSSCAGDGRDGGEGVGGEEGVWWGREEGGVWFVREEGGVWFGRGGVCEGFGGPSAMGEREESLEFWFVIESSFRSSSVINSIASFGFW